MDKVGRYVVISELGRGAVGIVYKASDPTIDREVALKVLSLKVSPEEGYNSPQQMFMREVRAAGRLSHPSIVTIHDAFDDKETQTSCIVMELVPGKTLEKILESGHSLSVEQILNLVRQVAEGLDYAHRNQVIHRDLKPANILVTEDGLAKITDFGIAKVLVREGAARTVGIMGTPSFMSPEQVKGDDVDARSDIFSLGIILFTMLGGKKPFVGNTAAVMFKIVYEEPAAPSTLNPQLTPAYDYVVKKCLAKNRNHRYSSARELVVDLDDLQHGRPPRSQTAASAPIPTAAPPTDRTLAMPIPGLIKRASQRPMPRPAPPTPPSAPPLVTPAEAGGPLAPPPTMAMPISELMKAASQQPASRSVPAPPASPPVVPAPSGLPLTEQTLPMYVPDLSAVSPSVTPSQQPTPKPSIYNEPTLMERALPMQVPALSADSLPAPSSFRATPAPSVPPDSPLTGRTLPMQVPDFSATSQVAGPPSVTPALPPQIAVTRGAEPAPTSGPVLPAPKSKLIPAMFGGVAVVLLAVAMWGYWKFHQARTAPPPQLAVQTQQAAPPPVPTPVTPPTPSPAPAAEQPAPPVSPAPEVTKKTSVHKPKQAATPHPSTLAPGLPPAQPQPVAVTPAPQPAPPSPSPETIAKPEPAKTANVPRIVQVSCNYGLKEATFTFSSGGKSFFEETLKGKKKKGGFLEIKGSFQGSFTQTITVPAGASEVSLRVVAKDGGTDLSKAIKMPSPGGFVPTLAVEVDSDHLSLIWKSSSAAN